MSITKKINGYAAHEAGGRIQPYSYNVGELNPNEVEIDVLYCGICHSDLSMIDNEWGMSQYPLVAGHEVIGTVAGKGNNFVTADYSQFELRIAAILSGDKGMIEAFNSDVDIHTQTAAEMYGVPENEVQEEDAAERNNGESPDFACVGYRGIREGIAHCENRDAPSGHCYEEQTEQSV